MTSEATMVERVARAIYEKRNGRGCTPWSRHPTAHKEPYLTDARVAIAAMREPTEAMHTKLDELLDAFIGSNADQRDIAGVFFVRAWRAMVDSALSQQPNTKIGE